MMGSLKRKLILGTAAPVLLLTASSSVLAASHGMMECRVNISRTEVGFIVKVGGGSGTLVCPDEVRRFRVGGFQVGGAGLSGARMTGTVKLKDIADFEGRYSRGEASITTIKGGGSTTLTNSKGVEMTLSLDSSGASATLGGGGMTLTFE